MTIHPNLFGDLRRPVVIDLFAGGGGASHGMRSAGYAPTVAINHDEAAIRMHAINHPEAHHFHASVWDVKPGPASMGRAVRLLWASPDCRDFSAAKGSAPRSESVRCLAWVVVDWAREVRPSVICLENVQEFRDWGPLDANGQRIPERKGEDFRRWVQALEGLGYVVEWRLLVAADYGVPTSRKRLYLVARCDGQPIGWPEPTHGKLGAPLLPWRSAAECIDWEIPCRSIFERKKPLAEATQRRIAEGVQRYVLGAAKPFLLCLSHGGRLEPLTRPLGTITAHPDGGDRLLVAPFWASTANGEREGQTPRVRPITSPLTTVCATGSNGALVAAFLAKHYGGPNGHQTPGSSLMDPLPTVAGKGQMGPVAIFLDKLHGSARAGILVADPFPTVAAGGGRGGGHAALVSAFLTHFYGSGGQAQSIGDPMHVVTTKARHALVTVSIFGEEYILSDIGMRMLEPRELARAQGFPEDYILTGTKAEQIARIGNSVCPPMAEAIVRAQFPAQREAA